MKIVQWGALALVLLAWRCGVVKAGDDDNGKKPAKDIKMEFKDASVSTVLEQLSDSAGLTIVYDGVIEGRINIISKNPMNVDQAISLLNTILKEKGFIGIRTENVLKIVPLSEAKRRNIPVVPGRDPAKVKANDDIITQVIQLQYVDAVQLKKEFAPFIPSYGDITSNAASNSLIITDTGANVKRMLEIIVALDTQTSTTTDVKVFQLKYANASNVARMINEVFKTDTGTQQNQAGGGRFGGFRFGGPGGNPGADGGNNATGEPQSHQKLKVNASADERNATVLVSAPPDTMELIKGIVRDLDSNPATEQAVFIYHLKNAQSRNLEGILNALFAGNASGSRTSTTASRNSNAPGTGSGATRSQGNSNSSGIGGSSSGAGTGSSGSSMGLSSSGTTTTNRSGFNQGAGGATASGGGATATSGTGDLTGQVYIVADNDSNSLMVLTPQKNFERVRSVIGDLDKPVRQVVIKVLIAEVTHEITRDVGTDASLLTKGAVQSLLTNFGDAAQTTGAIARVVQGDVSIVLHALETEGKLEVLSRPSIVASDNQASNITVGQEVPFIVSSRTTDTGQTVNTIQYQDIGIILNVTAHINEEGLVIMDVAPEVSSLTGTTVPISDTVNAPVFAKRSASTRVGVVDGQTVVIGGLMEDRKTANNTGIPVLRNIPGLGYLFGRRQSDKTKTELLIFLTPHVAQEPYALEPMARDEADHLKLVPHAVEKGMYEEHREGLDIGGHQRFAPPDGEVVPMGKADNLPVVPPPVQPGPEKK